MRISAIEKKNMVHLQPYLNKDGVTDLHINQPKEIFIKYGNGVIEKKLDDALDFEWLCGMAYIFASQSGQEFDTHNNPIVGFKLPGGHRVQIVAGSATETKFTMAIRVNKSHSYPLESYGLDKKAAEAVEKAVRDRKTLLISGGTGTGKTSFLNTLLKQIDPTDRIVTVEDVRELVVNNDNFVPLSYSGNNSSVSNIDPKALLNAILRFDPTRILLGEIRQQNALTFFRAINTGHDGSMGTIHANTPKEALTAISDYMIMNGDVSASSTEAIERRLKQNIYGVIQLTYIDQKRTAKFEVFGD